jgi:hypothetical protein
MSAPRRHNKHLYEAQLLSTAHVVSGSPEVHNEVWDEVCLHQPHPTECLPQHVQAIAHCQQAKVAQEDLQSSGSQQQRGQHSAISLLPCCTCAAHASTRSNKGKLQAWSSYCSEGSRSPITSVSTASGPTPLSLQE